VRGRKRRRSGEDELEEDRTPGRHQSPPVRAVDEEENGTELTSNHRRRSGEDELEEDRTTGRHPSPPARAVDEEENGTALTSNHRGHKRRGGSLKRGNGAQWLSSNAISNAHGVPPLVVTALSMIFTSAERSLAFQEGPTIFTTLTSLLSGQSWLQQTDAFRVDSLDSIAARCLRTEEMEVGLNFISLINMIQFVAKIERFGSHFYVYSAKIY
jgi:hypothetical protein